MCLPDIEIAFPGDRLAFLDTIQAIAAASGRFAVDRKTIGKGDSRIEGLNLRLRGEGLHKNLCGQLLVHAADAGRVRIEVSAHRWRADHPTRADYVEAAQSMFQPLLGAFNQAHGQKLRLHVERQTGAFRPTERTKQLLDRFVICANTSSLHPLDWQRFYELVLNGRQEIPALHLLGRLREGGFSDAKGDRLVDIYQHLWAFKKLR